MARRELSTAQKEALAEVRRAHGVRRDRRKVAEIELRERLKAELLAADMTVAMAVRHAYALGLPVSRIGEDGLGTRDPHTPRKFLAMTEAVSTMLDQRSDELLFSWADDDHTAIRVNIPDFVDVWEHAEVRAPDWPKQMRGTVERDPEGADAKARRSGWTVVYDEAGPRGWFTEMVLDRANTVEGTLPNMLDKWAEANS